VSYRNSSLNSKYSLPVLVGTPKRGQTAANEAEHEAEATKVLSLPAFRAIRAASCFMLSFRADLVMRGSAISLLTLVRVALPSPHLDFFSGIQS